MIKFYSLLPSIIKILITSRCNLNCIMCGNNSVDQKKDLSTNEFFTIFNVIQKSYRFRKKPYIKITGGEPFCREDIFVLLEKLSELGLIFGINTNGLLLNPASINRLFDTNISSLTLSIDSLNEKKLQSIRGNQLSFDHLLSIIEYMVNHKRAKNKKVRITIRSILQQNNYTEYEDFVRFAHKYNIGLHFEHLNFITHKELDEQVPFIKNYTFSNPEGRIKIYQNNPTTKDFINGIKKLAIHQDYSRLVAPMISAENIEHYFNFPQLYLRNKRTCQMHNELRIRNNGEVAFCVCTDGFMVNWSTSTIKDVVHHKKMNSFRSLTQSPIDDKRCSRCFKLQ